MIDHTIYIHNRKNVQVATNLNFNNTKITVSLNVHNSLLKCQVVFQIPRSVEDGAQQFAIRRKGGDYFHISQLKTLLDGWNKCALLLQL